MTKPLDTKLMHKYEVNLNGNRWFYIGTCIKGSTIRHGFGITVWEHGEIHEGYYQMGKTLGPCRRIYKTANVFEGYEFKSKR